jgi:hypothetical protein
LTRTYPTGARTPREGLQRHRRGEMGHEVLEAYTEVKAVTTQPYRTGRAGALVRPALLCLS